MSDDELRARLGAADPAGSVPPVDPARVTRLLEDCMSTDPATEHREDGPHGRSPLTWLLAAAAVAVIAGTTVYATTQRDGSPAQPPPTAEAEATVTELSAPPAGQARCMVPTVDQLADKPIAFDGTVEEVVDGLVTLDPIHWYAGRPTDLVTIEAPPEALGRLLVSVDFEEGQRYLVAATDDRDVVVCGFSGAHTKGLEAMYVEAFGG